MKKRLRGCIFSKMSFVVIFVLFGLVFYDTTFAVTFQQEIGVNFTFNSSISLSLSSDNIHIYNLAPGSASDSNVIDVRVLTNSINGYTLNATVGNNTTYNTRDLTHSNSNINNPFTSIDFTNSPTITTNTDLASDKWAFSFSVDNGTNWSNYNGLPLYSDTTNIATLKTSSGPSVDVNGDDIKFKIAAKASESKPSGDYHNVINFNVVAAPTTMDFAAAFESAGKTRLLGYYQMQDMTGDICSAVEVEEDEIQLIDNRDNKVYWVAKLKDGNCWMTQNLDHDIVTNTDFYTYNNTDIGHGPTTNTSATWTAARATYATTANHSHTWCTDGGASDICNSPESYDPGNLYWSGVGKSWDDYVAYSNTCEESGGLTVCDLSLISDAMSTTSSTPQYHFGNYYNWAAALATNDSSVYDNLDVVEQSICPAGWTLPRAGVGDDSFRNLWNTYGFGETSVTNNGSKMWEAPLYFALTDVYAGYMGGVGISSAYWTPVAFEPSHPYHAHFAYAVDFMLNGGVDGEDDLYRSTGVMLRCIARPVSATVSL